MRKTKCQLVAEMEKAPLDEMDAAAYNFEMQGWSMSIELAPRCNDRDCEFCHN